MSAPYDASFHAAQAVASMKSARAILPELFSRLRPTSVLDVGCGIGPWLRVAGDLGARILFGVDGDYVERRQLMIPLESFISMDLGNPGLREKVVAVHPSPFDLVLCLEVAEHLPFERSASLVEELCQLGDVVLFSAAIPFQGGTQHVNEQWPEFWALLFRSLGFVCYDWLRQQVWAAPDMDWRYAQNALLFVREGSPARADLPATAVVKREALSRVHPHSWLSALLTKVVMHWESAWRDEAEDLNSVLQAYTQGERLPPVLRAVERARLEPPGTRDVFWTRLDNALLADVSLLTTENKILNAEKRSLDAELQRLMSDNESLSAELQRSRADIQSLDEEFQRSRADNQSLDAELRRLNRERKDLILELHRVDAERQRLYQAMSSALHAWLRYGAVARRGRASVMNALRGIAPLLRSHGSNVARSIYKQLPLPIGVKTSLKSALFSLAPLLFRHTLAYRSWEAQRRRPPYRRKCT
jgi:SAM-dependent methyltransferase